MSKTEKPAASSTKVLVECAMLVALSCVLSLFPKFKFLAYGGSITVCSMLPIVLVSYRRGIKWGLLSGLVFALFQMLTGFSSAGISIFAVVMVVLFDYLLPFTLIGLGGMFRGRIANKANAAGRELALGSLVVLLIRYLCHVVSGFFVWGEYAEWFFSEMGAFGEGILSSVSGNALALLYSVVYNASYMLPEILLTVIVSLLVGKYALFGLDKETK